MNEIGMNLEYEEQSAHTCHLGVEASCKLYITLLNFKQECECSDEETKTSEAIRDEHLSMCLHTLDVQKNNK